MSVALWPASKPLPSLLNADEMQQVFGLSRTQFYAWKRAGKFKDFEVKRPIGNRRYSGQLVERHRAAESTAVLGGRR